MSDIKPDRWFPGQPDRASMFEVAGKSAEEIRQRMWQLQLENKGLRSLLAHRVVQQIKGNLYTDDGELQDNAGHPSIDFLRDDVSTLSSKLIQRTQQARQSDDT